MELSSLNRTFSEALTDFIARSDNPSITADKPELKETVDEICAVLKIARLKIIVYETVVRRSEPPKRAYTTLLFSADSFDESREFTVIKNTREGNRVEYSVCPYLGSAPWSEEEKKNICTFITAVYIINGRERALGIAERLSYYDAEMNVNNLKYLMKTMGIMIKKKEIAGNCICRFNLKRFSAVNTRIGRDNGTAVMIRFISGLKEIVGESGVVSRLGGDNFILLFRMQKLADVQKYLMGTPIPTDVHGLPEITISAYAGYMMINVNNTTPEIIMEKISAAQIAARQNPKEPFVIYNEALDKKRENKKLVESLFPSALKNEEFLVYYQPKINLKDHSLSGAEALCRWQHDSTLVPPMNFIPILEQSNNICMLDFYMLEHVCRDMRRWLDSGLPVVKVSVNMSRMHMGDENLSRTITEIIDRYDIPHEYIEIELTETTTDVDFKELKQVVASLHNEGIHTSVDDFGVGYSSLNLIRDLPWNVLKIDRSFLPEESDENKNSKEVMLKYVISMAHSLGLECIVEGVETEHHIELLTKYSCYRAQGFYFDKPLPVSEFEKRLSDAECYNRG